MSAARNCLHSSIETARSIICRQSSGWCASRLSPIRPSNNRQAKIRSITKALVVLNGLAQGVFGFVGHPVPPCRSVFLHLPERGSLEE